MTIQMEATDILEEFIANRSPELRERLVLQSVPLVHYLLGRMGITQERGTDYEDLAHQGLMGLIEAVDHFDPKFNAKFSTYASLRIRGKVMDYLRTADWMPRSARKRSRMIQKSITTLWSENSREPTDKEIASHMGTSVEDVQQGLADSSRSLVSLDLMMEGDGEGSVPLHEKYGDEKQVNPLDMLEEQDLLGEMSTAIKNLPEREQLVLSLYYTEELTFKDIGKVLDITESRVCQLHARAIISLKAMMKNE
jgi:RNA polymerase sigma factor for flagellar operon FliA